jgi:D-alanyl-D-alanine carboxypeptidase/D-alanyl-D-alanine-endopeptidase (penicillin-binding protein 4)
VLLVLVLVAAGALVVTGRAEPLVDRAEQQWDTWFGEHPDPRTEPAAVEPPDGLELPEVSAPAPPTRALGPTAVSPAAVRRALAGPLSARVLGRRVGVTVSGLDGPVAWSSGPDALVPASTTKLLTSLAALSTIDPRATFATRTVLDGSRVVLVGGGDPLLERRPTPGRADLATLARATAAALSASGRDTVRLAYDDSLFSGPAWNPTWPVTYRDVIAPITALMSDDGRPASGFGRVADPSLETATTFAAQLRARGVRVLGAPTAGAAPAGATALASVESAPVASLVDQLLQVSDNETAEVLLRQVGVATSGTGSTAAGLAGVREVLSSRDVPLPVRQRDGSGLSRDNLVPPATLAGILQAVARSAADDPGRALLPGLPVAGFSGSLALRFDDVPESAVGRVRAKTGTLRGVRSLAGVVVARDGTPMVFALMADRITGDQDEVAEAALDRAAAALAACRCGRS